MRIGVIGSDTSHCTAFTKLINNQNGGFKVTTILPHHSRDISLSVNRREAIEKTLFEEMGLERVKSVKELMDKVDAILLLALSPLDRISFFNELSLYQKPVFIDKPIAFTALEAKKIFDLSESSGTPVMSCSALRFDAGMSEANKIQIGYMNSVQISGPLIFEDPFPGYFWYGIHLIEMMYSLIGVTPNNVKVKRRKDVEVLRCNWNTGECAEIAGDLTGKSPFEVKMIAENNSKDIKLGVNGSIYNGLIDQILLFFQNRKSTVEKEETIEVISLIEEINQARVTGQN
jgi:predicted dehydrogenase